MSRNYIQLMLVVCVFLCGTQLLYAQVGTITGRVVDESSQPLSGASVQITAFNRVVGSGPDGAFSLANIPYGTHLIAVRYLGFEPFQGSVQVNSESVVFNVQMRPDARSMDEVVVIGYGTQKRDELTGSITTVTSDDFQTGVITTPEQLISGKAAGVQITANGGRPGSGSAIRIRAGASLNASNDPLIVIDGVPISSSGIPGSPNALGLINPQDIESFTILKDANATAIYGSRASNGVILITTKKGASGKPKINFTTQNSIATIDRYVDVMTADEIREFVTANGNATQLARLGEANTFWQGEIFREAFTTDNNLSISGSLRSVPYRVGVGYLNQQGILKRDVMDRTSASIALSPKFLDSHLSVDLNVKGTSQNSLFADQGAIFNALIFDPTKPVHAENDYGNYWEWEQGDNPHPLAPRNPVGLLELRDDNGKVLRSFGNLQLDYKMHFLPELRANLNLGYDISRGKGDVFVPAHAAASFVVGGHQSRYLSDIDNKVLEFYLNYNKFFDASNLDLTAGYGYYDFKTTHNNYPVLRADGSVLSEPVFPFDTPQNRLISYYGRAIYTWNEKYVLSGTVRTDGSSRYAAENRWGVFPSLGFTWRANREAMFEQAENLSKLNLRLSYGVTGQQDGIANYSYLPNYYLSGNESQYRLGDTFYHSYSPVAYDQDIRWESTTTYNAGLDFGFFNNRIDGAIDVYYRETKDLLSVIPIPVGTNFSNFLLTNVGNIKNNGVELNVNTIPIQRDDFAWNANFNFTYNFNEVTNLTAVDDPDYFTEQGGIEGGTGQNVQVHTVGYTPYTYRLYKQVYDAEGLPLEGVYADLDGDGEITDRDRQLFKSPLPTYLVGFSTGIDYKRWSLNTVLRANIGHYIYDNVGSNLAVRNNVINPANIINNAPVDVFNTNFTTNRAMSDYYLHNASFLRMDNISVGYDAGRILPNTGHLRISANVQNVFVLTKYKGVDPELLGGIDNRVYPRPRTFVLGLSLDF